MLLRTCLGKYKEKPGPGILAERVHGHRHTGNTKKTLVRVRDMQQAYKENTGPGAGILA